MRTHRLLDRPTGLLTRWAKGTPMKISQKDLLAAIAAGAVLFLSSRVAPH